MSRWSRRSQEEKERIAKMTRKQSDGVIRESPSEIYLSGNLPIYCIECGEWSYSHNYTLKKEKDPFFNGDVTMIYGNCVRCGAEIKRAIYVTGESALLDSLVISELMTKGKIKREI